MEAVSKEKVLAFVQTFLPGNFGLRQHLCSELHEELSKPEFPDGAVREIVKVLAANLRYYHKESDTFYLTEKLIRTLSSRWLEVTCASLTSNYINQVEYYTKSTHICLSDASESLCILRWTNIVLSAAHSNEEFLKSEVFQKVVEMQPPLVYAVFVSNNKKLQQICNREVNNLLKQFPSQASIYREVAKKARSPQHCFPFVGVLLNFLKSVKDLESIEEIKSIYKDHYVESIVKSREKLSDAMLMSCQLFLSHLTHEDFKTNIWPVVDRFMLRNPEITLICLTNLISCLSIDLSQYAFDVGKHFATQCISKEETQHVTAIEGCRHLAKQCTDPSAIKSLVEHFFRVLSGSEGKLSLASQKVNVLTALGKFSQSSVSGSSLVEELSAFTVSQFVNYLQTETVEATATHGVSMMSLWTLKFGSNVPSLFVQWVNKSLSNKAFTSSFRSAVLICLASMKVDALSKVVDCLPTIIQALEKSIGQPFQIHLVAEAVHAACVALRFFEIDFNLATKCNALWTILLDTEKQHFANERFLNGAPKEALKSLSTSIFLIFTMHSGRLNNKHTSMYVETLLLSAIKGNQEVRKNVLLKLKRLASSTDASFYAFAFLNELSNIIVSNKIFVQDEESFNADRRNARLLYKIFYVLCNNSDDEKHRERIAQDALIGIHHPCICRTVSKPWIKLLEKLKIDPVSYIEKTPSLFNLFNSVNLTPSHTNAFSTLVHLAPVETLKFLKNEVSPIYSNPTFLSVTLDEFALLTWPEGELFDKSFMENSKADEREGNIKRESKLYSYKEQLAEIELKKELAKKKAVKEDSKPTKKQQESMQAQLSKETNTRNKLKKLVGELEHANKLVEACMNGNLEQARLSFHWLLPLVVDLFKSPLAAAHVTDLFLFLGKVLFKDRQQYLGRHISLGVVLSHCTFRLLKPKCLLDRNWSEEPVIKQAERVIDFLAYVYSGDEKPFCAPSLHFSFYFLNSVLKQKLLDDGRLQKCLTILSFDNVTSDHNLPDKFHPFHLPRKEIMELCFYIIGSSKSDALLEKARTALLSISRFCNGDPGHVEANDDEINCLLDALLSPASAVRNAALESLLNISKVFNVSNLDSEKTLKLIVLLWLSKFDVEEANRNLADKLFEGMIFPTSGKFMERLVEYTVYHETCIREACSNAVAAALSQHPQHVVQTRDQLLELYKIKLHIEPAVVDPFGRVLKEAAHDDYPARCGIALAFGKIAPFLQGESVEMVFEFFISNGLLDCSGQVRSEVLKASIITVNEQGKKNLDFLLEIFKEFLENAPHRAEFDYARQGVVILMGTLAKHLDADHPSLKPIVLKLIDALSTPSEQVQSAVANCLPPLVPPIKDDAPGFVKNLMSVLLESDNYGERRGAAYGLAGFVKGLGILSLKQLEIVPVLTEAIQNKKNGKHREGALLAFEMLSKLLGRLFEPYVVHILPQLLLCFGDHSPQIRKAADETAKVVMGSLSAHGVKLVLPSLLNAIEEDSWRTKCASVELLGSMAHCAPKQLSACLPNIVPKLTEVLTDSHVKVQNAGCQALRRIGSVIKNPEIQSVVPILLGALQDPTKKTTAALQKLLDTQFVHFIDAPSLALIMPVVQRALSDRSTDTRRIAAQIVGNMCSLTDQKDLSPYHDSLIPGLRESLLNPMPEVRTVSAKAFGTMVRGMGEKGIEDLIPWLMQTLASESSTVDRSGAAQGLSEVVGGLGLQKLQSLMPDIIQTTNRTDIAPNVRDGYIMMYIYLPTVFGDDFIPYIGSIIPSILKALADETEYVRETALKAGQRIVNQFADTAVALLLPEVEKGLFDDNWRIRYSSVQLLGDILFRISGVSGKMTTEGVDDDDNFGSESSLHHIQRMLGPEQYNRVFAGLYICRQDGALQVRQIALHIWKMIIAHTPRTLKEIMSELFHMLLGCLASQSHEKRQVAARTLGDIVKKLGEKVLPEIIPILEKGLDSEDSDQRQGVCIGLSEIMNSTSKDHVVVFADSLIPSMRKALCDPLPSVRKAAASTFDVLHANLGPRTLEDILPDLLKRLDDPQHSEHALDGLKQVMAIKSRVVLPYLIPQLTSPPVNTRALCFLSSVAGESLTKHLVKILPAITTSLAHKLGTDDAAQEMQYCKSVILSLQDEAAIRITIDALVGGAVNAELNPMSRVAFLKLLHIFCEQTKADYSDFITQLLRSLIHLSAETNEDIINTAWDCLNSLVKKIEPSNMLQYISHTRQAIRFAVTDLKEGEELPGFSIPKKGIAPLIVILREGVLSGGPEVKESASLGLSEAIRRTNAEALRPSVVNITGALIRILGDRYNFTVKVAMLDTLSLLLSKCGANLKPFLPQLQTTFMKAFNDVNRNVRLKSAEATGKLVTIHNRVDALFTELMTHCKGAEDTSIRDTLIHAVRMCLTNPSCKIIDKTQRDLAQMLESFMTSSEDSTRTVAAACLGALCICLDAELLNSTLNNNLLDIGSSNDWTVKCSKSISLCIALKESPGKLLSLGPDTKEKVEKSLAAYSSADRIPTCLSGLRGTAYLLRHQLLTQSKAGENLIGLLAKNMKMESNDVKQLIAQLVSFLAHATCDKEPNIELLKSLVPVLLMGSREKNAAVKSFSEHALLSLLRYRKNDSIYQTCLEFLEPSVKSILTDITSKILKKLATQPELPEDDIDITILK